MSFQLANQAIQRFVMDNRFAFPFHANILALKNAIALNQTIQPSDVEFRNGKERWVKITQYAADCDIVDDNCDNSLCDAGRAKEPVQQWFRISKCIKSKNRKLSVSDLRLVDGAWNITDHALKQIMAGMAGLRKELAEQIDADLLTHAGVHLDGNQYKRIAMANTTSGLLTPLGMFDIQREFADGGYIDPFILGATEVDIWRRSQMQGITYPNTTLGQDMTRAVINNLYYDNVINTVVGDTTNGETIIAFDPNAVRFVSFSENVGMFATELSGPQDLQRMYMSGPTNRIKGVIIDPDYGIAWDFNARFDECEGEDGAFVWYLRLKWDIFYPNVYSCNGQGVNGIFLYKTCPVKIPTCPTGDTPSPAITPVTFAWTPDAISDPFIVSSLTIGGVTNNELKYEISALSDWAALLNSVYPQATFTVNGSDIEYDGWVAISGTANSGTITITFAV